MGKILYLKYLGLLHSKMVCGNCHHEISERARNTVDQTCWSHVNHSCELHRNTKSIRYGSFFESTRLSLHDGLIFLLLWSAKKPVGIIIDEYTFAKRTVIRLPERLRNIVKDFYDRSPMQLGGRGVVCQIDEMQLVHKVKHHRGRPPRSDAWVFGITERSFKPGKA